MATTPCPSCTNAKKYTTDLTGDYCIDNGEIVFPCRKVSVSGKGVNLVLTLCYSPLPTFSLIGHDPPRVNEIHSRDEGMSKLNILYCRSGNFCGKNYLHVKSLR